MWYSSRMMKLNFVMVLCLAVLYGCATGNYSRSATLLSGMHYYQDEMHRTGNQTSRWPERQRVAGDFKMMITGTVGASSEFYRLVDLDLRRREFILAMREINVGPDRLQEMKDELRQMEEEVAALKPVIKTQLSSISLRNQADRIEDIATLGLLGIALDDFSSNGARGMEPPSTKVGQYLVTDLGTFSTVKAADGRAFQCAVFGNVDDGAGVRCEAVAR